MKNNEFRKITSFSINHDVLEKGIYVSRIDNDIITYDLRFVKPNVGPYLENDGLHTFEHLFATFVRNSKYSDEIIYFGPMGCRTGFYFVVRDSLSHEVVIKLINETCEFIADFEGEIPGSKKIECGNYLDHNLLKANKYARDYLKIIKNYTVDQLSYKDK